MSLAGADNHTILFTECRQGTFEGPDLTLSGPSAVVIVMRNDSGDMVWWMKVKNKSWI